MVSKAKLLKAVVFAGIIGVFVTISWAVVDTGIHATGDYEFCTGCHSHIPIGTSFREDIHGGNNSAGWRATCSQCHIPHDNALHYLWVKGVHGVVDPTMEILKDPYDIDWHGNRERRSTMFTIPGVSSAINFCKKPLKQIENRFARIASTSIKRKRA